uniref:Olfactory receptor 25 n=1 Tax=Tribolium castaneum TaxID=7070 RepID=C0Z3S2_TRICA|nr:olfactory receptor 25 [Tribolium castaneum]
MTEEKELRLCLWSCYYLKLSLMWPLKREEFKSSKGLYLRLLVFVIISGSTFTAMIFMHLYKSLKVGSYDVSEDLAILASNIGYVLMMTMYVSRQKDLELLLLDLSDFKTYGKPPNFDKVRKRMDLYAHLIFFYSMFGSFVYNMDKIILIDKCKEARRINEVCGSAIPFWTPFETEDLFTLTLVITYVLINIFVVVKVAMTVSVQVLEISSHINLRIEQLKIFIAGCFDRDFKASRERLDFCIRYHNVIIDFSERFSRCFSYVMFIHLAITGIIIGCLENQIVQEHQPEAMLHMGGWSTATFIACYGGQLLMDASTSIADEFYNCPWYEADVKMRKDLILIILRAQKALFVSTGPFNVLSFALFVSLKTSFIWPPKNEEMTPSRWFYIKLAVLLTVSVIILYVPVCIHIHKLFERDLDASEDFALMFSYYGFLSTMIFYSKNHKKICGLIYNLCSFEEFGKPPQFDELNQRLDFYSKLASGYTIIGMAVYIGMKIYKIPDCKAERGAIQVCGLTVPLLCEQFNEAYYWTAFSHIVCSVLACACVAHQAVNQDVLAVLHYIGWIMSIFVVCWAGQILTDSSVTVADACFGSNWLRACPRLRRDLSFMMRRSQKCVELRAGPFNVLCFSLFVSPIITKHICERQNAARHFDDICGLVTNSWMPFDIKKFPNKQLFYLWQTYSVYWTYEGSAAISYLIVATMEHVLMRIWHLQGMIQEAINTEDAQVRKSRLDKCLEYHNHVFLLAADVDRIYQRSLFVHVLFSGVLFGIMGFSILTVGISVKTLTCRRKGFMMG